MVDTGSAVINKSVTAGDYSDNPMGAIYYMVGGTWGRAFTLPPSLLGLPLRESDYLTITTPDHEGLWAGTISIAVTKVASLSWEIEGEIPLRNKRGHELMLSADAGRGWVSFISKLLQDFLLTSNGAFVEVVRQTTSLNSQIIGIIPLDSLRCTRTGDPEFPVIYRDLKGREHELRAGDVLEFADLPSSRASMFGSGKCAAARAYPSIYKLANIEAYVSDKVSGRRPLAVHLLNGLNAQQLNAILDTANATADAKGVIAYMGAIMATVPGEQQVNVATIPLADFPDNFNRQEELNAAALVYADNVGLDVQDIQPLTGRALGTGAQSEVLDEKAKGKGLSAFRQQFVHSMNTWVLPDLTTMMFIEKDWRDKKSRAEVNSAVTTYVGLSIDKQIISPKQGLQVLVDEDVYPKEFLPSDDTPDTNISDAEKPDAGAEGTPAEEPVEVPAAAPLPEPVEPVAAEKSRESLKLMDETSKDAVKLAMKFMDGEK